MNKSLIAILFLGWIDKISQQKENLEDNRLRLMVEPGIASQLGKQSKEEENRYSSTTASKSEQETSVEVVEKVERTGN